MDALPRLFLVHFLILLKIPVFQPNYVIIQSLVLNLDKHRYLTLFIFSVVEQLLDSYKAICAWLRLRVRRCP